jgi:hypothetical protein
MPAQEISGSQKLKYVFLGLVLLQTMAMAVFAYARLGDFRHMPDQLQILAIKVRNPSVPRSVPIEWTQLCRAWESWLPFLQKESPRLLQTEGLWTPDDPLRSEIADFLVIANELRPESLIPQAAAEKDLRVLAESPSEAVMNELMLSAVHSRANQANLRIVKLAAKLEKWPRWEELRSLLTLLRKHDLNEAARALEPKLPLRRGSPGYRTNAVRTLTRLNDLSRDNTGLLPVMNRWSEITRLATEREAAGNADNAADLGLLLGRLTDHPTLAEFADSLKGLLDEMRAAAPTK